MKTTKKQDCIIEAVTNYQMAHHEWNELTKDMEKPIWIEDAPKEVQQKYIYLEKYEAVMNAVLNALDTTIKEGKKLTDEFERSWEKDQSA